MKFNKGEWSELYAIFYLLCNRKLHIVDSNLKAISNNIFLVESIFSSKKNGIIRFDINNEFVVPTIFGEIINPIKIEDIEFFKNVLFKSIITLGGNGEGSFEIKSIDKWLCKNSINISNFKASSQLKEDINLLNFDVRTNKKYNLGYSIKSQLGSPATILNASNHTNFRYKVKGLNTEQINEINSINTRTKLKDRIEKIYSYRGKIFFDKVISETFETNLKMIDMLLPEALAECLIKSYEKGEKDLKKLFENSSVYSNLNISIKKLEDFLTAVSFGMFPSEQWDGRYSANGGLIIVTMNSEVYVLDMVYFYNEVKKYLINETKLDSPSSSRYDMLRLEEQEGEIYFTLNLQVRYKK